MIWPAWRCVGVAVVVTIGVVGALHGWVDFVVAMLLVAPCVLAWMVAPVRVVAA